MKEIMSYESGRGRFFAYARARHEIYLKRAQGQQPPHTEDPILSSYRFTNVFRELDKTTAWFRQRVSDPLARMPEVLLATVVFRMLNRIAVGEAMFLQPKLRDVGDNHTSLTAFEEFCEGGSVKVLGRAIRQFCGKGPYVTGAYIISTPPGYKKLDGVLEILEGFRKGRHPYRRYSDGMEWPKMGRKELGLMLLNEPSRHRMQDVFDWLGEFPYLGKFHSYEIVTDLRYTALLEHAPDKDSWANLGPGARRGLNRIADNRSEKAGRGAWGTKIPAEQALEDMRDLLACSRNPTYWPQGKQSWPRWELREVEHTLCEFDKYCRVYNGEGAPRGRYP